MTTGQDAGSNRVVPARRLTEAEERLVERMEALEVASLQTLEAHARQVVTLSTTLLAAFLGLLSLGERPGWLARPGPQVLAALTVTLLFLALALALDALLPRRYAVPRSDLRAQAQALAHVLERKHRAVTRATWAFAGALLALLATVLVVLWWG